MQTQKSVKLKGSEKSGNSASDDWENNASNGLNVGDGSDDGSGAQVKILFYCMILYGKTNMPNFRCYSVSKS